MEKLIGSRWACTDLYLEAHMSARRRQPQRKKDREPSEGYKAMTEIVFDGIIKGAKYVYDSVTGEAQKARETAAKVERTRLEEEQKRTVPRWAR